MNTGDKGGSTVWLHWRVHGLASLEASQLGFTVWLHWRLHSLASLDASQFGFTGGFTVRLHWRLHSLASLEGPQFDFTGCFTGGFTVWLHCLASLEASHEHFIEEINIKHVLRLILCCDISTLTPSPQFPVMVTMYSLAIEIYHIIKTFNACKSSQSMQQHVTPQSLLLVFTHKTIIKALRYKQHIFFFREL